MQYGRCLRLQQLDQYDINYYPAGIVFSTTCQPYCWFHLSFEWHASTFSLPVYMLVRWSFVMAHTPGITATLVIVRCLMSKVSQHQLLKATNKSSPKVSDHKCSHRYFSQTTDSKLIYLLSRNLEGSLTLLQCLPIPIRKLSGLMSRWMKFLLWTYSILPIICAERQTCECVWGRRHRHASACEGGDTDMRVRVREETQMCECVCGRREKWKQPVMCTVGKCPNKALPGNISVYLNTRYQHLLSSNSAWLARLQAPYCSAHSVLPSPLLVCITFPV